ncbi:hypothetical protein ACLBXM_18015 [Xanthobacteraceae bacterium A53D]
MQITTHAGAQPPIITSYRVYLDDVEIHDVFMADDAAGIVVRLRRGADGGLIPFVTGYESEVLTGEVRIELAFGLPVLPSI